MVKMEVNIQTITELHKLILMDSFKKWFMFIHFRKMLIEVWSASIIDLLFYISQLQFWDKCFSTSF